MVQPTNHAATTGDLSLFLSFSPPPPLSLRKDLNQASLILGLFNTPPLKQGKVNSLEALVETRPPLPQPPKDMTSAQPP